MEWVPSFSIVRPVTNIGEEDIAYLEGHLNSRSGFEEAEISKLFKDPALLGAMVVANVEIQRLHRILGPDRVNKEHTEKLIDYLTDVLPDFSKKPTSVPALPSMIHEPADRKARNYKFLTVAGSTEVSDERIFVRGVIQSFYGLETMPENVWYESRHASRVRLASASNSRAARMLDHLHAVLTPANTLLPSMIELGPVEIRATF